MDTLIGKTIGRYRIVEHLGRGGMAEVYKAYQENLDRYVAIKLMHSFLADDKDFFNRFTREARNVAALRHPNIIQIHDFDREGDTSYMVMEFVDGGALKDRLEDYARRGERLPLAEAIRIIKDVGAALAYAHRRGMIHRDVKPANVMLDSHGRVILTDFGIAKVVSGPHYTASGAVMGTPAYMAPEQGLGQPGDARADIYSLGVMLYQLVTGRLPYDADTPVAVILKHVNEPLPLPSALNADVPLGIERIIIKALAKDPNERYQTVEAMLADLNDLKAAENIELPTTTTLAGRAADRTVMGATVVGGAARPSGATQVAKGASSETVAGASTATPTAPPTPASGLKMTPLLLGGIGLLLVAGIALAAIFGGGIIAGASATNTLPPTLTVPASTPTFNPVLLALTESRATDIARDATFEAALATATRTNTSAPTGTVAPTSTVDATAAFASCVFNAEVAKQDPSNNSPLPVNSARKITLEIKNTGQCDWGENAVIAFVSGDKFFDANTDSVKLPPAKPGEAVSAIIPVRLLNPRPVEATWQIKVLGNDIGQPIVLSYRGFIPATFTPTQPPASPTPEASPAAAGAKPITGANPTFFSCTYIPNTSDYECLTNIGVGGGAPPFTITIDGLAEMTGVQTPDKPFFFKLRGRRCLVRLFSYRIVDSAGQVFDGNGAFDPTTAKLFNNNTEVCGLGGAPVSPPMGMLDIPWTN
jgi:tRNA A-37 threonylcarbamoyl transferase component Bud32